MLTSRARVEAD